MTDENKETSSNLRNKWIAGICGAIIIFWFTDVPRDFILEKMRQATAIATQDRDPGIGGYWDISIDGDQKFDSVGSVKAESITIAQEWDLQLVDNRIKGELQDARSALGKTCDEGDIIGTASSDKVQLILTFSGDCCPDEKSIYELRFVDSETFIGVMKPESIPKDGCVLWAGKLRGKRRTS